MNTSLVGPSGNETKAGLQNLAVDIVEKHIEGKDISTHLTVYKATKELYEQLD
jgi:hypothetical protein